MKDSRLVALLLLPSLLSLSLSAAFGLLVLLGANWPYLQTQPFLGPYLSGEYSFGSLMNELNAALGHALNSDLAYNLAVMCFAILIGLGFYAVATSFRRIITETQTTLNEVEFAGQGARPAVSKSLGLRLGLRFLCAIIWLGYTLVFFNGIVPYGATLAAGHPHDTVAVVGLYNIAAFGLLCIAGHLHAIFIRLILLRPRVFGGRSGVVGRGGH